MNFLRSFIPVIFPLVLVAGVLIMITVLHRRMKKSLYSYTNIELVAGILFASVFSIVFFNDAVKLMQSGENVSMRFIFTRCVAFPQIFTNYAVSVLVVVAALLCISNIALIRHEGLRPKNVIGIVISGVYLGGTFLAYALKDFLYERILVANGLDSNPVYIAVHTFLSVFLLVMICYFECILAGTAFMGWKAAHQHPSHDRDFIIIPGCAISKAGGLLPLLRGRVVAATHYAWEQEIACGKSLRYIPSGGQGPDEIMSEGSCMELYLISQFCEEFDVLAEKKSRNTYENFLFSKQIIDEQMPGAKVAFATTNYHMLRCGLLAKEVGLDAEGIASQTKWYFWPNGFVREFIAILAMHIRAHVVVTVLVAAACTSMALISLILQL